MKLKKTQEQDAPMLTAGPELTVMQLAFLEAGKKHYERPKRPVVGRKGVPLNGAKQDSPEGSRYGYRGGKLGHLYARGSISARQHEAGQSWVDDYRRSTASKGALQEGRGGHGDPGLAMEAAAHAGRRFAAARSYIGLHLAGIVWAIVGLDRDPTHVAAARQGEAGKDGLPRKVSANAVIEVLRVGLDGLAEFYGID